MARQMTQEDRRRIDHLLAAGMTINDIAADLGRNRATILRESDGLCLGVVKMPQTGGFQEDRHAVSHA